MTRRLSTDTHPALSGFYSEDVGPYQTRYKLPVTGLPVGRLELRRGRKAYPFLIVTHDDVLEEATVRLVIMWGAFDDDDEDDCA